jgi:ATP synthase protein I
VTSVHAVTKRLVHLPMALWASGALLIIATIVGWLTKGGAGAAGAAAGVVLVVASYVISSVVIAWADAVNPKLIMPVGLATYGIKFVVIGVVMWVIASTDWAGLIPMAISIIVAVLVWTLAQSVWTYRAKILYVDPSDETPSDHHAR